MSDIEETSEVCLQKIRRRSVGINEFRKRKGEKRPRKGQKRPERREAEERSEICVSRLIA